MSKDYPLRDAQGAPAFVSAKAMLRKTTSELRGICQAFLMDGIVTEEEAKGLRDWIQKNPIIENDVMAAAIVERVRRMFDDGKLELTELIDLRYLLQEFSGDPKKPIQLPVDVPAPRIVFPASSFCFTGKFISGSRRWCQDQVIIRGGIPIPTVMSSLRYLVIGSIASPAWANMNYGTKIESAVALRDRERFPLSIVTEEHWLCEMRQTT